MADSALPGALPREFVAVVPVKPPARGKSRLGGLPDERRRELATAFALDTVQAALATPGVLGVLVVTDDFRFAGRLADIGCSVIPDGTTDDLNATLVQAAAEAVRRWPGTTPAALCADLPCLTSSELAGVLGAAAPGRPSFVRDRAGTGTTLYVAPAGSFAPRFGPGSAERHVAAGVHEITVPAPTVRHDVDELADLSAALVHGVGAHTAAVTGRA